MGEVRTDLTLNNVEDKILARNGLIQKDKVRSVKISALADTGAWTLVLTEKTAGKLGLKTTSPSSVTVAGGGEKDCRIAEPVEIQWKDRSMICEPLVLPGEDDDILGVIPMEGMDLIVCPKRREVVGAHGDKPIFFVR